MMRMHLIFLPFKRPQQATLILNICSSVICQLSGTQTSLLIKGVQSSTKIVTPSQASRRLLAFPKNIDTVWCLGVFDGKRVIIGTAYVKLGYPSGITELVAMLDKAKSCAKVLKASGVILCGDLNSRHTLFGDKVTDVYGKKLIEDLNHCSYSILYPRSPSFIAVDGASSVIDLFVVSNNIESKLSCPETDVEVELFPGAPFRGHVPVISSIDMKIKPPPVGIEKPCFDNMDWDEWSKDLDDQILKAATASQEGPCESWNLFQKSIDTVSKRHAEKKIVTCHSKPFWTTELTELSEVLRKAKKAWYKRNIDGNRDKMTAACQVCI